MTQRLYQGIKGEIDASNEIRSMKVNGTRLASPVACAEVSGFEELTSPFDSDNR